jgi:amidase
MSNATQGTAAPLSVPPADLALFEAAGAALGKLYNDRVLADCLAAEVPGGLAFPLAEPAYTAKRPLDFSPFAAALQDFPRARAAALDSLLPGKTIPDLHSLMAAGDLTAAELVTWYVDRIARYDVNKLNSVLALNPDALAIAAELDTARAAGALRGPLHGIPVLLKDNIATGDRMHTTAGAYALKDWHADRDAFLAARLRAAGAVILGKTNLSEWANYMDPCMPSGFSVLGGQTRSPYGPFDPSGSSSGSAVAVAAHFATVSVGSETSGSLTQPGRSNSLVALRPSLGLLSRDHIIPLSPDLDTAGPMARSVTDAARLLNVLAAADSRDPKTAAAAELRGIDFTQHLSLAAARDLRVGVLIPTRATASSLEFKQGLLEGALGRPLTETERRTLLAEEVLPDFGGDPAVAVAALAALGIPAVQIDDSTLPPAVDTASPLLPYGFRAGIDSFFGALGPAAPIKSLADVVAINNQDPANRAPYGHALLADAAANQATAAEYARIHAASVAFAQAWLDAVFAAHAIDVLVSGMAYTSNAGAAGIPALTIPAGLDPQGRPQGIILTGPYGADADLLALGYALEQHLQARVEPDLEAVLASIR